MPGRQEPNTPDMVHHLISKIDKPNPDSLSQVLADWCVIGLQVRMPESEWCQDAGTKLLCDILHNEDDSLVTFTPSDMIFYGRNKKTLRQSKGEPLAIKDVHYVKF